MRRWLSEMSKEWEDKYLVLKKENERLKELQRDQAQREHKIAARLVSLKEQQLALQEGRAIAGDGPREAKLAELQASLYSLESQHQQLTSKLHAMKNPSSSKTSSSAVRKAQPAAQQPKAGKASDSHGEGANRAQLVVAQLKREILETNLALSKIKEQQTSGELQDSLAQFKVGHSGAAQDVKEREELKRELKTKEAKYTLAKSKLDSLDKEYKDYVQKHKQLINQAEETQRAIFEQQKQHRTLEAQIKQLKLEKDQVGHQSTKKTPPSHQHTLTPSHPRTLTPSHPHIASHTILEGAPTVADAAARVRRSRT